MSGAQRRQEHSVPWPKCNHDHQSGRPEFMWANAVILGIDTETTGVGEEDVIVELGAALVVGGDGASAAVRLGSLVNPGRPIPPEATAVHGIRDSHVELAPSLEAIAGRFLERVRGAEVLAGYNCAFDFAVLERQLGAEWTEAIKGKPVLDALALVRSDNVGRWWKGKGRHRLDEAARRLGLERRGQAHRASSDAALAIAILHHLEEELPPCAHCASDWLAEVWRQDRERFEEWLAKQPPREGTTA